MARGTCTDSFPSVLCHLHFPSHSREGNTRVRYSALRCVLPAIWLRFSSRDQREDAGVLQQRGLLCQWADFETGEEAGDRNGAERAPDVGGIVARNVVEAGA